jgi:hypothetical protein
MDAPFAGLVITETGGASSVTPLPLKGTSRMGVAGSKEINLNIAVLKPVEEGVNEATSVQFPFGDIFGLRLKQGFGPPVDTLNIALSPPVRAIAFI